MPIKIVITQPFFLKLLKNKIVKKFAKKIVKLAFFLQKTPPLYTKILYNVGLLFFGVFARF
ncbi:hypothetical protein MOMA_06346 [Moraxella macacae 0408225]|uniref:Uncharacterized protein n=1 Tax=Moraxella macacae 0408225 TaxID=1230338 RepID=L2F543_9GAMM|nr:hypothetical protein MOMA_06346 [Moraxella macacae 0408225]